MRKYQKFAIIFIIIISFIISFFLWIYLKFLPFAIKQDYVLNEVKKITKETLKLDLEIKNPELKTSLKPIIELNVPTLVLKNANETIIDLENFSIIISFNKIYKKEIKLNKIYAETLIIKLDKLLKYIPQTTQTQQNDWKINYFGSDVDLDYFELSYIQNKALFELYMSEINLSNEDNFKYLNFNSETIISKNKKRYVDVIASSINEVKIYQDKISIEDFNILINDSKLNMNALIDSKDIKMYFDSPDFRLKDIFKIVQSGVVIPDGETLLKPLINPKGKVMFKVDSINNDLDGIILIDDTKAEIKDLTSIPIKIQRGVIKISPKKIDFINLKGYWGKSKKNEIKIYGDIKDYYKTLDSNITIDTIANSEFFRDYLSKLINNTVIYLSKPTKTRILYKAKNNIMDIIWLAKINKGTSLGVTKDQSKLINFDRAIKGDFHIENNILDIKDINYYIAPDIHRGIKLKPVLSFDGKFGLDGKFYDFGFNFKREIPCEFLNVFTKEKTFKKGTIKGSLHLKYKGNIPYINSDLVINKTLVPSQRLFIEHADLTSDNNFITFCIKGGFKRIKFDFDGKIENKLVAPFIIRDLTLDVDKIDVEHFLNTLNGQGETKEVNVDSINNENDIKNDNYMFDTNLIRIKNCDFKLNSGNYKDINFSDIKAKLTLDENGILDIKSNKFNIANGTSSLKFQSDLKNLKHHFKLGVRKVDSNLIAKTLLNLDKEIDGKANGIIEINTDKTLQLNGKIKFLIEEGTIGKIGLVEYLLKVVSLFRNPIAMINPITIMDIISVPQGNFDKIQGELELKNNVATKINIKSYSDNLSALIKGRFDLNKHDASMRIYTRFSSSRYSKFEFLRNISLNTLANKVPMNSKNDENYYSSELKELPQIKVKESKAQIFLTEIEGDIEHNNFISSLRKIK